MYLGGNHVRVVCVRECEKLLKCVQRKQGLTTGSRGWLTVASRQIKAHVPSMPKAEASHQLFTTGQKSQAGQAICSQLELSTQPSREVKSSEHPVWQNMTFHISSHLTIYIFVYPRFKESFQREF